VKLGAPIYQINDLKHAYRGQPVLDIERLAIQANSIVGLIGPNGSGKSTLLKLLGFIEKPVQGKIFFKNKPVESFSPEVRFQVTLLSQEPYLMRRSVYRNISYGLRLRGNTANLDERIDQALALVGLTDKKFAQRPWYALSGGEAQRIALAARLVLKPEVLLLDEPTASVDAVSAQLIKEASLRARKEWGTTLVIASHDWQWLYEVCDDILHLFKGRIFGSGRENIVFGPWQPFNDGFWGKQLPDGQYLLVSAPPTVDAVAIIEKLSIDESIPEGPAEKGAMVLSGFVQRLTFEKHSGDIIVALLVGNLPFTIKLSQNQVRDGRIYPGRQLHIGYHPDSVRWL
jgi:tungstate transport system ATP-binding protein